MRSHIDNTQSAPFYHLFEATPPLKRRGVAFSKSPKNLTFRNFSFDIQIDMDYLLAWLIESSRKPMSYRARST